MFSALPVKGGEREKRESLRRTSRKPFSVVTAKEMGSGRYGMGNREAGIRYLNGSVPWDMLLELECRASLCLSRTATAQKTGAPHVVIILAV